MQDVVHYYNNATLLCSRLWYLNPFIKFWNYRLAKYILLVTIQVLQHQRTCE